MSPSAITFTVPAPLANQRLDIFLSNKLKITGSQAKKIIDNKQITINNKQPKKAGDTVKSGHEIKLVKVNKIPASKFSKSEKNRKNNIATPKLNIVAETDNYLIIDKPTGLLTHQAPQASPAPQALSQILAKNYPGLGQIGDDPKLRPGIVHRFDKEASGLMVVARTQKMFTYLKQQFKNRQVKKEYLVLVHGKVRKDWDEINFPIKRTKNSDRMAAIPKIKRGLAAEEGKEALTEFTVEKRFVNFTLLRVKIHTGRTHQIRAHLLAYNHPVVGDPLYFQKKQKRKWDEKCGRLFLHCSKLGFVDLDNQKKEFMAKLPVELKKFLKELH